jgi:hypothetical protein
MKDNPPLNCEVCGRESKLTGRAIDRIQLRRTVWVHPDDYSRPVVLRWVCRPCHRNWHRRDAPGPNLVPLLIGAWKRLSSDQIEQIRYLHSIGLSREWIAKEVGCSVSSVWRILRQSGTKWKSISQKLPVLGNKGAP